MKTVIITGAAGFIGSHLCDKFLAEDFTVIGIDDFSSGNKNNLRTASLSDRFIFINFDISQKDGDKKIIKEVKQARLEPEIVIHLAAKKIPRYGGRLATLTANVMGTKNILELVRETKSKFVFSSTSDVYGMNPQIPFSEESNSVIGPGNVARWAYAISKLYDEQMIFGYAEGFKIPVVVLRYFGSYGPRHHRSWLGGPQSVFIDAALAGKPLTIHGDGMQTRSFCYISDTIEATFKATMNPRAVGEIINIGNDEEISIIDMAKLIVDLVNSSRKSKLVFVPYWSFTGKEYQDVRRRIPDISKAKKLLDWEPQVGLKQGLKNTISWHRQDPIVL